MIKHLSVLPFIALLLVNTACGDEVAKSSQLSSTESKEGSNKDPESGSSGSSSTTTTPKGAFELKLDGLVKQTAPWGNIEISVEQARLLRGDKPAGFPSKEKHSKDSIYAILDVKLESNAKDENDYTERKTWDLLLGSDKRVEPLNALGVKLGAGQTQTVTLFYKVEENTSLKGASLEINGNDRSKFEPMKIPLDVSTKFESQVELPDLMGELFEADEDGELDYEIVNALYGVNLESSGRRADKDKRLVELTVRVGNTSDSSATFSPSDEAVRISVDGSKITPEQFDSKTIQSGERETFVLVYSIAEDLTAFDLVFDLGGEVHEASVALPGSARFDDDDDSFDDDSFDSDDFDSDDEDSDDEDSDDEDSDDEDSDDEDDSSDDDDSVSDEDGDFDDDEDFEDDDSDDDEDFDSDDEDFEDDHDHDHDFEDEDFESDE